MKVNLLSTVMIEKLSAIVIFLLQHMTYMWTIDEKNMSYGM